LGFLFEREHITKMKKLIGEKMKMTSIFKDGVALGVTPIKLSESTDLSEVQVGVLVRVSGTTKGHGFTGVVKRWDFRGGPATHGQKNRHRAPGSIGSTAPQRVLKGRRMAGRMGMDRVTIQNMRLVDVNPEQKIVMVNGAVPGTIGRRVEVVVTGAPKVAPKTDAKAAAKKK
jgi:ribosomal protein L3